MRLKQQENKTRALSYSHPQEYFPQLDIFRGLGALLVLIYHYFIFFFTQQSISASLLAMEPLDLSPPFYLGAVANFPINIGDLGVAFFFLISGFLIRSSLVRYVSLKLFLIHKLSRLWPTFAMCFSISLVFVWGFCQLSSRSFPYSYSHILSYFLWVRDLLNYPYIDGTIWTLEIQLKFYLLAAIVWYLNKDKFLEKMCILTITLSFVIGSAYMFVEGENLSYLYLIEVARKNLIYFTFILLGSCIYSFYKQEISSYKAVGLSLLLFITFLSPFFPMLGYAKINSFIIGYGMFSCLIFISNNKSFQGVLYKFIKAVAALSYPLYLGHVLPGYTIMYYSLQCNVSIYIGIVASLISVVIMAYAISHIESGVRYRDRRIHKSPPPVGPLILD
ncbi:MAG: acyltransferase [Alphaproteobacteria bacterium]|nr:acyltransferase [Alphaproteobacteria bacterium]